MKALGTTMMLASAVVFLTALFFADGWSFLSPVGDTSDHCPVCFYGGYPVRYRVWSGIFAN